MGTNIIWLIIALVVIAAAIGALVTFMVQKSMARSRAKIIVDEAAKEAEVLKKNKLLEAREEGMKIKNDAEREVQQRMSRRPRARLCARRGNCADLPKSS